MTPDSTDTVADRPDADCGRGWTSSRTRIRRCAMADEFPEDAAEWTDPVSRRQFLTLMGASLALAGAAGCNLRPASQRKIVPYVTQPDEITPGVPLFFATAFTARRLRTGVLVRSHEGRPIKVEGNPTTRRSLGGTDSIAQASRPRPVRPGPLAQRHAPRHCPTSYDQAVAALREQLYDAGNGAAKNGPAPHPDRDGHLADARRR